MTKAYKATLPATTPAEESTTTGESGKDSQPKTGEEIPMALVGMMTLGLAGAYTFKKSNVFVVGNVYAEEDTYTLKPSTVQDCTNADSKATAAGKKVEALITTPGSINGVVDYSTVTVTYNVADLKLVDADEDQGRDIIASWLGIKIDDAKLFKNNSNTAENSTHITATLNGKTFTKDTDGYHIFQAITPEVIKEALKGDGNITRTYTIVWTAKDGESKSSKTLATFTQTINLIVKADNVTITNEAKVDGGDDLIWTKSMAEAYKIENPTTPAEETTTTEESGKDSQPKTGEEIPMALVGMMTLGLAGAYTFKKSYNN